jgi:hypothetical protein
LSRLRGLQSPTSDDIIRGSFRLYSSKSARSIAKRGGRYAVLAFEQAD